MITQTAKPEAESQSGHRGARNAVRKWKSIYADQMMEDIKRGPEKGPVSMETVDKQVRLDVDAGKAVKESMVHAEQAYVMGANSVNQIVKLK